MKIFHLILVLLAMLTFSTSHAQPTALEQNIEAETSAVQKFIKNNIGSFADAQAFVIGDPTEKVADVASAAKAAGLPEILLNVAIMITIAGFVKRGWEIMAGSGESKTGFLLQTAVVAIMISYSFNLAVVNGTRTPYTVSTVALNSWGKALDWSNRKFGARIDLKLETASETMVDAISRAAFVTTSLAAGELAVGAATMKGGAAALGGQVAKSTGRNVMKQMAAQAKISLGFMLGMIMTYSNIIYVSGLMVLFAIYIFPLGMAALMWGQSKIMWSCVGTFFGAWLVALTLPLVTYANIDRVFVEPARMAAKFEQELGVTAYVNAVQADVTGDEFARQVDVITTECKSKLQTNPNDPCLSEGDGNILKSIWKPFSGVIGMQLNVFNATIGKFIDSLTALILQVFFGLTYYLFAVVTMTMLSIFVMQTLGSAATNFGSTVFPKVNLPKGKGR